MPRTRPLVRRAPLAKAAFCFLLLISLAACDLSGSPSASSAAPSGNSTCGPEEVANGGIKGIVVDAEGNPLDDIFILIQTDEFRGDTRTGADGVFTALGVSGEFQITTIDIDYAQVVRDVTVPCGELVDVELVLTPVDG